MGKRGREIPRRSPDKLTPRRGDSKRVFQMAYYSEDRGIF